MWKRLFVLGLIAATLFASGCKVVDKKRQHTNGGDNLPWNGSADWESTGGPGIAY